VKLAKERAHLKRTKAIPVTIDKGNAAILPEMVVRVRVALLPAT
jgi:hypothetical protein